MIGDVPRSRKISAPLAQHVDNLYRELGAKETSALLGVPVERVRLWRTEASTITERQKTQLAKVWKHRDTLEEIVERAREEKRTHAKIAKELRTLIDLPALGDNRVTRRVKKKIPYYDYSGRMPKKSRDKLADSMTTLGLPISGKGAVYFKSSAGELRRRKGAKRKYPSGAEKRKRAAR
jgi:hypothetical protein